MHLIARLGRVQQFLALLDKFPNVDINAANVKDGKRPLHEAAQFGRHEVIRELLNLDQVELATHYLLSSSSTSTLLSVVHFSF